jgi:hypothetical protein
MRSALLAAALVLVSAAPAAAQKTRWTQIGTTSSGNPVYVDPKTVRKTGDHVDATIRVVFVKPVETPKGVWMSSRITGTFDCTARKLANRESVYFGDKAERKVVERKVNKIPGYSVVLGGSLGAIALDHLCKAK